MRMHRANCMPHMAKDSHQNEGLERQLCISLRKKFVTLHLIDLCYNVVPALDQEAAQDKMREKAWYLVQAIILIIQLRAQSKCAI